MTLVARSMDLEVFVYTPGGGIVPRNVVRIRIDPSVTSIPARAFDGRTMLAEVVLCEGLVEIGQRSFWCCDYSITKINIPTSLRRINDWVFERSLRCPIRLHDGIESIGQGAFSSCIFTNFRVPPLITVIPVSMLLKCRCLFSLELPDNVTEIQSGAFKVCYCLRNVALFPNAFLDSHIFIDRGIENGSDLQLLFDSEANIIAALQLRFNGLPIHSIVYYQSYHEGVLQILIAAINMTSGQRATLKSKVDPTGNQQDCLGMTPLHILACSSVHNLEVYRLVVENYPTNLITEDRWGATPLLYAFWGAAPAEIMDFLFESYRSLYPDHVFNWTMMVETMGRCDTPKERIENLLHVKQTLFPEQPLNWEYLLGEFASTPQDSFNIRLFQGRMRFLVTCGMSERVETLPIKFWRDHITNMIHTTYFNYVADNRSILRSIRDKLAHFEDELPKLKEAMTILELALWKMKIGRIENTELIGGTIPDQTPKTPTQAYTYDVDTRAKGAAEVYVILERNQKSLSIHVGVSDAMRAANYNAEEATDETLVTQVYREIDQIKDEEEKAAESQKRIKLDEASVRQQCRVTCGADVVIRHVLPYLISVVD